MVKRSLPPWIPGLLVVLAALWLFPLSPEQMARDVGRLEQGGLLGGAQLPRFFSLLAGRPAELCLSYAEDRAALGERLAAEAEGLTQTSGFPFAQAVRLALRHDEAVLALLRQPCRGGWRLADLQGDGNPSNAGHSGNRFLPDNAPMLWAASRLGVAEGGVALLLTGGVWLGFFLLYRLTLAMSGSSWLGLATTAGAMVVLKTSPPPPHFLAVLLIPAWAVAALAGEHRSWRDGVVPAVGMALGAVFLVFLSPVLRPVELSALLVLLAVGAVLARRWDALGGVALAALLTWATLTPYRGFTAAMSDPLPIDHARGWGGAMFQRMVDLAEGPAVFSLPHGDAAYSGIWMLDPLILRDSAASAALQTPGVWLDRLAPTLLRGNPGDDLLAVVQRLYAQVLFPREWSLGILDSFFLQGLYFAGLACAVAVVLLFFLAPRRLLAAWPLAGLVLGGMAGINPSPQTLHPTPASLWGGFFWLVALAPGWVAALWRGRCWRVDPSARRLLWFSLGAVITFAWTLPWAPLQAALREENILFPLRHLLYAGTRLPHEIPNDDRLAEQLERFRLLGERRDGTAEMFGVWVHLGFIDRLPLYRRAAGERLPFEEGVEREKARGRILPLYREALRLGRENPFFPMYARLVGEPAWREIFAATWERFPDHPYATHLACSLAEEGDEAWLKRCDDATGRLWSATASRRLGYLSRLAWQAEPGVEVETSEEGTVLRLAPGARVVSPPLTIPDDPRFKGLVYLRMVQGAATAQLLGEGEAGPPVAVNAAGSAYRVVELPRGGDGKPAQPRRMARLLLQSSAPGETRIVMRDWHPLITAPRLPRE
ncbi:MAG: hypothetical protein HQL51_14965 [Magnetococcales bacterium]|nr:hypothetical protein [Magnetococcales bacterium]